MSTFLCTLPHLSFIAMTWLITFLWFLLFFDVSVIACRWYQVYKLMFCTFIDINPPRRTRQLVPKGSLILQLNGRPKQRDWNIWIQCRMHINKCRAYKTSVYTLVIGDMQWLTHRKTAKIIKRWYHSSSRRLTVNVLLVISPFYDFCCFRCVSHCMSPLTSV